MIEVLRLLASTQNPSIWDYRSHGHLPQGRPGGSRTMWRRASRALRAHTRAPTVPPLAACALQARTPRRQGKPLRQHVVYAPCIRPRGRAAATFPIAPASRGTRERMELSAARAQRATSRTRTGARRVRSALQAHSPQPWLRQRAWSVLSFLTRARLVR